MTCGAGQSSVTCSYRRNLTIISALCTHYTVEPPNNESIGTANFILEVSLLRGTNILKSMQMVHWKNFIMRGVSLLGEFIIRGFTVYD